MEKKKNPHANHRKRLYAMAERIGVENLTDIQALELLLTYVIPRRDTNEIAHALLDEFGNISDIIDAPMSALEKVAGIGHRSSQMLHFMKGFFFLYRTKRNEQNKIKLDTRAKLIDYIRDYLQDAVEEQVYAFALNQRGEVTKASKIAQGTLTSVSLTGMGVMDFITAHRPYAIVIAHSHGESPATPSEADAQATKSLSTIFHASNVVFADSIIISKTDTYSFVDHGYRL